MNTQKQSKSEHTAMPPISFIMKEYFIPITAPTLNDKAVIKKNDLIKRCLMLNRFILLCIRFITLHASEPY